MSLYFVVKLSGDERTALGPFKSSVMVDQLKGGLVSWSDLAWSPHLKTGWKRIFEFNEFHSILPKLPTASELDQLTSECQVRLGPTATESPVKESVLKPPFYLHVIGSERGPFSLVEVRDLMTKAKLVDQVYIWCKGLSFWLPIQEIPEFSHLRFESSRMTKTKNDVFENAATSKEGRSSNREGFVATAKVKDPVSGSTHFGVCMDISKQGVQVRLENHFPLVKGQELALEIIPLTLLGLTTLHCKVKLAWYKPDILCLGAEFLEFERDGWNKLKKHVS